MEQTDTTSTLTVHLPSSPAQFDGQTYQPERDLSRLFAQLERVRAVLAAATGPLTLAQISAATGDPAASASARLRDLRKARFGGHTVERTYAGGGLFRYQLIA